MNASSCSLKKMINICQCQSRKTKDNFWRSQYNGGYIKLFPPQSQKQCRKRQKMVYKIHTFNATGRQRNTKLQITTG